MVDRVPQILDRIQNYISSAISAYSNGTAASLSNGTKPGSEQTPPQLNQFLGLFNGFISATNNLVQQFIAEDLESTTDEETIESTTIAQI